MHLVVLAGLRMVLGSNHVVLGPNAPPALEIRLEGVRGTPHLEVNVGRITPVVQSSQAGRWIATWRPPDNAYPQVALLAAWDDADAQLAVLPLWGTATLPVQADAPDAQITLEVAGRKFTGHAGRDGRAVISFVAPPGPRTGLVRAVDRLGNVTDKEVPLGIPEVPRILVAASPAEVPADGRTRVVVRAFAATPDAKPDESVALVGMPSRAVAPGIAMGELPGRRDLGTRQIAAGAGGNTREVAVHWVTGPPATIEADARSRDDGTFIVTAQVVDRGAHPVAAPLNARAFAGALDSTAAAGGALATRYRPQRPDDPGVIVFTAGTVQRRLVIEPGRRGLRWLLRGISTSNLAHVFAAGALFGAEVPLRSRVALLGETGVLLSSGDVPGVTDASGSTFSFVAVPLRLGVDVTLAPPERWQPFLGVHAGVLLVSASAGGHMGNLMLAEVSESELAFDAGAELGLRWRLGPGALLLSIGWDYAPVLSGKLLSGSLAGLSGTLGYRL